MDAIQKKFEDELAKFQKTQTGRFIYTITYLLHFILFMIFKI